MQPALRLETTVLPGHRLEVIAPELPEGAKVEVIVILPEKPATHRISVLEFLESLPPGPRLSRPGKSMNNTYERKKMRGNANRAKMGR